MQHRQRVVDAAPFPVGPAVGQAPVSMDECPAVAAGIARQVTVAVKRAQVLGDPGCERVPRITVVMEMELDLAEAGAGERGQPIEKMRAIFLAWKKPAVARRSPVAVAKRTERRVALRPDVDAALADVLGGSTPQRFVVI